MTNKKVVYKVKKMKPSDFPPIRGRSRGKWSRQMEAVFDKGPGYGFTVPASDPSSKRRDIGGGCAAYSAANSYAVRNGKTISVRRDEKENVHIMQVDPRIK